MKCNQKYEEKEKKFQEENQKHEGELNKIKEKTNIFVDYEKTKNIKLKEENDKLKIKQIEELKEIELHHQNKLQ